MRLALMLPLMLAFAATPAQSAEKTIVVLDASGSMWGQIDGKTKIEIARETLASVLTSVPATTELGLMVYGHREKGSCADIELAVPPMAGSADAIRSFVDQLNPKGKTPISDAVQRAADVLKYTEEKATVVLVTDGIETCDADPCALASALESKGVNFTAHVVGFGLTEEEGRKVACLAENTGGRYLQASDAGQLVAALTETVVAEPMAKSEPAVEEVAEAEPEPAPAVIENNVETDATLVEGGPSLGDDQRVRWDLYKADADGNKTGDSVEGGYDATLVVNLPPGSYVGEARVGELTRQVVFEAKEGEVVRPAVNFEAGLLKVTPKRTADDAAADESARIDVTQGDFADGGYGILERFVPQGDIVIDGKIGPASARETVSIKAGETLEHVIVIGSGVVVAKAIYAEGGPEVDSDAIRFDVVASKANIDGKREDINGGYGTGSALDIPAGEFVLTARLGSATGEIPFSIKAGERADVSVNLNAGVLAISAPGANRIDIKDAKKDIQGNRKDVSGAYGIEHQDTLHPGDYLISVTYEGDTPAKEATATVKAGERTEITVE